MAIEATSASQYLQLMQLTSMESLTKTNSSDNAFQSLMATVMGSVLSDGEANADTLSYPSGDSYGSDLFAGMLDSEDGIQSALAMLCMMLSTNSGSSNSLSSMMAALSAIISNLSEDTQNSLRTQVLSSDASNAVMERVDNQVFGSNAGAAIPYQSSKAVNPTITSTAQDRSASLYRSVIDQFSVETNPRYQVNKNGNNETYCNIFMWDVTRAMGAEIPHYVDPDTLAPMYYPNTKGARELTANGIYDWLSKVGETYGWHQVTAEEAQDLANQGNPVVAAKRNNSGHGHVQVVCPSEDGVFDADRGVTIAQAGSHLYNYASMKRVYGTGNPDVVYYAHD